MILNLIGLGLNFFGSLLVAFSVIKNPGGGYQVINNKKLYLASVILSRFKWGIILFSLGFLIQFIATIYS